MKTYRFHVYNLKSDAPAFWITKQFPSAYFADRYAMRVSYQKKNSPYLVVLHID